MTDKVTIREVGPRDGLQSAGATLQTAQKVELIRRLTQGGLGRIEVGSFSSPRAVPLMADTDDVVAQLDRSESFSAEVLIPNARGAERAREATVDAVVMVIAASESFNLANTRMTQAQSLAEWTRAASLLDAAGIKTIGAVATAFGCPFEGHVSARSVARIVDEFVKFGAAEVILADTTGIANPVQVRNTCADVQRRVGHAATIGLHTHNTRGMGLANIAFAADSGITLFDSSVGGIGGCPFAPEAAGNVATEDMAHMLAGMGFNCGVGVDEIASVARWLEGLLGYELPGQVMRAGPSSRRYPVPAGAAVQPPA